MNSNLNNNNSLYFQSNELIDRIKILSKPGLCKATMYKLIRKEGNNLYGWSLFKTLTRSEVDDGKLKDLPIEFFMEDIIPE